MTAIILGLGSNIEREHHLRAGVRALSSCLGNMRLSPVYDCDAVGFAGDPFLNMVVAGETSLAVDVLARKLREIELANGRAPDATRYSPRTLDIDLLTYGDVCGVVEGVTLPRPDMIEHAYVLKPLSDLLPDALHPQSGMSYRHLWQTFDATDARLQQVQLSWK